MTQKDIIKKLTEYFNARDDIVMAFLFGSQVKDMTHSSSDWDIAVYFKPEKNEIEWENNNREYPEEDRIWSDCIRMIQSDDVDLIVLNRAPATIAESALDGLPLVMKDRGLWLEFMLRISQESEDFRRTTREYAEIYWRSTSLTEKDADALERRLVFLDSERKDLSSFISFSWIDYQKNAERRRSLERLIENLINAAIDISKIILASEKRSIPKTYKEMLSQVGIVSHFSADVSEKLSRWAELRNILSHEYLDIRWKQISDFLEHAPAIFEAFIKSAREFAKN